MNSDATEIILPELNEFSCRVCLKNYEKTHAFSDAAECSDGNQQLGELYKTLTKIEIKTSEKHKPTSICENCTNKLIGAYEFMLDAQRAEEILTLHISETEKEQINYNAEAEEPPDESYMDIFTEEATDSFERSEYKVEYLMSSDKDSIESLKNETSRNSEIEIFENYSNETEELNIEWANLQDEEEEETNVELAESPCENIELLEPIEVDSYEGDAFCDVIEDSNSIGSRLKLSSKFNYTCNVCERSFAKLDSFKRHKDTVHNLVLRKEITAKQKSETFDIVCPYCPRNFKHKNDLKRHVSLLHPEIEPNIEENEDKTQKRQYKKAKCPHCDREFPVASLSIHIRRHLGVNPYECHMCEKAFPRRQDLNIHIRQHTGEKPHVCTVCGKSFIQPNKLSRHMRIHLDIRPYKCDECGKSFRQSNDLKIHQRRHTGEKPYACYCGEAFISGTALRQHRNVKMHNEQDMPDPYDACRVNTRLFKFPKEVESKAKNKEVVK